MAAEVWRDVVGWEGRYQVSDLGRVRSNKSNRVLKTYISDRGYPFLQLSKPGHRKAYAVHRLVAFAFLPPPSGDQQVNHINHHKLDARAQNLEWLSASENVLHSWKIAPRPKVGKWAVVLNEQLVREIREARKRGESFASIGRRIGVDQSCVREAAVGNNWKHVV